jgi:8-oxo-dGTP pyrophosphatase MutT (NUDIX family)
MNEEGESGRERTEKAAAICYRPNGPSIEILLVRSNGGGWIFPKGSIETAEKAWQAAQREAFEEAGVTGEIDQKRLTTFLHFKKVSVYTGVEYQVAAFLLLVRTMQPPQEKRRDPTWFSPQDAEKAITQNRQFKYAEELKHVIRLAVLNLTGRNEG